MRSTTYLVITLGLVAQGATAHADTNTDTGDWFPAGATTDRIGTETWAANAELAYNAYDDGGDGTLLRLDLYGQYLAQLDANRLGGYVWMPVVRTFGTDGDEETGLGSLELGGAFAMAVSPETDLVLRGGLVLPTVDENDALLVLLGSFGRLTDLYTSLPDFTWLRLSGSALHDAAPYFVRADLGFDVPFSDEEDITGLLRVNLAAGIDLGAAAVLGELATLGIIGDDDTDESFLHTLALTLRGRGQTFSPGLSLVVPLDDSLNSAVDFVVVGSIRIASAQ